MSSAGYSYSYSLVPSSPPDRPHHHDDQQQQQQHGTPPAATLQGSWLPGHRRRPGDKAGDDDGVPPWTASSALTPSSPSPPPPPRTDLSDDDLVDVVTVASEDGVGDASFLPCEMRAVPVSAVLMPSPCYVAVLLLCAPVLGLVLFVVLQQLVPAILQVLVDM